MAMRADFIWMNGEIIPWDQAQVHVFTHALHYGSSVFEGLRAYELADGPPSSVGLRSAERMLFSCKVAHPARSPSTSGWPSPPSVALRQPAPQRSISAARLPRLTPSTWAGAAAVDAILALCPGARTSASRCPRERRRRAPGQQLAQNGPDTLNAWPRSAANNSSIAKTSSWRPKLGFNEGIALRHQRLCQRGQRREHLPRSRTAN